MKMIRWIAFDGDGVTIIGDNFGKNLKKDLGIDPNKLTPFFKTKFSNCLTGKTNLKNAISKHLDAWKFEGNAKDFLTYWFEKENNPNTELLKEIQKLRKKGIKCALATNQEKHRKAFIEKTMHFGKYFDKLIFSCDVKSKKPEQKFFDTVEKMLKAKGEEILFFDDELTNVDAAIQNGWNAKQYKSLKKVRNEITQFLK